MVVSGRTQRTWMCLFGKGIHCKYGRKRRKKECMSEDSGYISEEKRSTRKRKREADEAKAKKLISERAAALMEESLKNRGFIAERGFKNIISPFVEIAEKRE